MSNDFSTDDCVDEGICLDSTNNADRMLKPKVHFLPACCTDIDKASVFVSCLLGEMSLFCSKKFPSFRAHGETWRYFHSGYKLVKLK